MTPKLQFLFNLSNIIPDLSGGLVEQLHVWLHSTGTLHIAPLIFLCCPFCITRLFSVPQEFVQVSLMQQVQQGFHQQINYSQQLDMVVDLFSF